jgi:hypothetical protein
LDGAQPVHFPARKLLVEIKPFDRKLSERNENPLGYEPGIDEARKAKAQTTNKT